MTDVLGLKGRTAIVIGGTSGIGRAIAVGLAVAGANVIASGRRSDLVDETAAELREYGADTIAQTCDVRDVGTLYELRDSCVSTFRRVDALINAAGTTHRGPTLETSDSEWNEVLETNLTGTLRSCRVFAPTMVTQGYGRIVNIGSLASFVGLNEVAAYTASKSAVLGLTRALAVELATSGVCVNALIPGVFVTDLNRHLLEDTLRGAEFVQRTPMRRFGEVEELRGAALLLSSPLSSFMTGQTVVVDGGLLASGVNS